MQIVIDIDEEDYKAIKNMSVVGDMTIPYVFNSIRNGILLPKGHGRLIDESKIAVIIETEDGDDFITDAPTIIESEVEE